MQIKLAGICQSRLVFWATNKRRPSCEKPRLVYNYVCSFNSLDSAALIELNANAGDILYIAPSWDIKPNEVDPACVTTIDSPTFNFNITQCVPIANVSK